MTANYLVCSVLYDPSLDQRILRWEKTGIYKTRKHSQTENQTDWLVHLWQSPKAKHRFSPTLPSTLNKRNIPDTLVNNEARVNVVSDKCV